ncbi:energy transducer TonB [Pararhodobacter sp. SW119]|uniref:energy transducer TonB n=1 Tax=Pararhodobacter sp. SW119 TaxID=2780075 RepID=UPI001AE070DE|nr:energy transducer TonB [Pararhodobacter sp. SW119]
MALLEQMHTGHKASAVMHGGLILWVAVFGLISAPSRDRSPPVADVALLSAEEFAALSAPRAPAPDAATPAPEPAPAPPPAAEAPIAAPPPAAPPPSPPAETGEETPPQAAVRAPEPTPDASLRPVQRPAERVAPEAAPAPDPETQVGPRDQAALVPDPEAAPSEAPPAQDATAPEAAATETVTEATEIDEEAAPQRTATAPEVSLRPLRRPARPTPAPPPPQETEIARATPPAETPTPDPAPPQPQPEPTPQPEPEPQPESTGPSGDAVMDALSQALAGGGSTSGMTAGDIEGLRLDIERCWNVGLLSLDAQQSIVTIGFEMTPDARPIENSIQLVDAEGGSVAGQRQAFDTGRRAIIECGVNGYGLPSALYDQWREIEITFNPARMSNR